MAFPEANKNRVKCDLRKVAGEWAGTETDRQRGIEDGRQEERKRGERRRVGEYQKLASKVTALCSWWPAFLFCLSLSVRLDMKGGDSLISPNQKTGASPLQSSEKQTGKIKKMMVFFFTKHSFAFSMGFKCSDSQPDSWCVRWVLTEDFRRSPKEK